MKRKPIFACQTTVAINLRSLLFLSCQTHFIVLNFTLCRSWLWSVSENWWIIFLASFPKKIFFGWTIWCQTAAGRGLRITIRYPIMHNQTPDPIKRAVFIVLEMLLPKMVLYLLCGACFVFAGCTGLQYIPGASQNCLDRSTPHDSQFLDFQIWPVPNAWQYWQFPTLSKLDGFWHFVILRNLNTF